MSPALLLLLIATAALWISQSFAMYVHPNIFAPESNATCLPDYAWMNNAEGKSSCLTVAYVIAACVGDTWIQPALPPNSYYDPPNGSTATPCYCSWSCYNLMMGCTLCQNQSYTNEMLTWPAFSQNCPSTYTDDIFPSNYVIANNVSIPYWATINRKSSGIDDLLLPNFREAGTWPNALFNIDQAQTLANQHHSDYYPSSSNSSSSSSSSGNGTNVGAIIGGTVGGAAALLLIAIGGYYLYRWRQCRRTHSPAPGPALTFGTASNASTRWPSNTSPFTPALTSSSTPISYTAMQPYGTQVTTIAPSPYASSQAVSLPPTHATSFYATGNTATQQRYPAIPIV